MIQIQQLSKNYGRKEVLVDINLHLEPGKVYGIVGENGAGKTTLFKCMAGLERYSGTIKNDFGVLKDHLGFLQTNPFFFKRITGGEYLRLLCNARGVAIKDLEKQNIFELPLQQYAATYSTGMKKKLALTGILLQQNDFFILDEPFNGVDIHSNIIITALIHKLKALNKIIVISSHIFSTLSDTCDEIYLLRNGLFEKRVEKEDFVALETEMKAFSIGDRLEGLEI